jgi:hypothetical protein
MLAALVTLVGGAAPAGAYTLNAGGGGPAQTTTPVVAHHHSSGSSDWLIAVGAAGGVALVGAGVAGSRRANRRTATASQARAASGS